MPRGFKKLSGLKKVRGTTQRGWFLLYLSNQKCRRAPELCWPYTPPNVANGSFSDAFSDAFDKPSP